MILKKEKKDIRSDIKKDIFYNDNYKQYHKGHNINAIGLTDKIV